MLLHKCGQKFISKQLQDFISLFKKEISGRLLELLTEQLNSWGGRFHTLKISLSTQFALSVHLAVLR